MKRSERVGGTKLPDFRLHPADLLLIAAALAIVTAFAELSLLALYRFLKGYTIHLGLSVLWMTPVAISVLFSVPAFLLILLSRVWQRVASVTVVVAVLSLFATIGLTLVERHLTWWAMSLLALGVAFQVGKLANRAPQRFLRLVRRGTLVLGGLVLVLALVAEVGPALRERRNEATLPAARIDSPNVLLIILDTVRALSMNLYGYDRETTPHLAEWAKQSVVFDQAVVPGTWTVPSHISMLSGVWTFEQITEGDSLLAPTLAGELRKSGYRTGGFVGNWYHIGSESVVDQGFIHYSDIDHSPAQIARGSALIRWLASQRWFKRSINQYETLGRRDAPSVSRAFLRWIDRDGARPFFAMLNYFDVHSPYLPPPPFNTRFGSGVTSREPIVIEELNRLVSPDPELVQAEVDAYDGALAYMDDHIGWLLNEIKARGLLENTIVIIASDHGEELGEHGRWGHAYSLYREIVHVPLIILGPGVPAAERVRDPVSLREIPATVADLVRLPASPFPGQSLSRFWRSSQHDASASQDTVLSEQDGRISLYSGPYHYLEVVQTGREELYDTRSDVEETRNLLGTAQGDSILASIKLRFAPILARIAKSGGTKAPVQPDEPGS